MTLESINKQIQELEAKKKELLEQLEYVKKLSPAQRLADLLHSKQCHFAHEDQCGWFYESWDNPGYSRNEYLSKANKMLREFDFDTCCKMVNFV